jgi:hypothetical protein
MLYYDITSGYQFIILDKAKRCALRNSGGFSLFFSLLNNIKSRFSQEKRLDSQTM